MEGIDVGILDGTVVGSALGGIVGTLDGGPVSTGLQHPSMTESAVGQHRPLRFKAAHCGFSSHLATDAEDASAGVGSAEGISVGKEV